MKTAINVILGWITCTDPTVIQKWTNIAASFWHKDEGAVVTELSKNQDGDVTVTIIDGDENSTTEVIEKYNEPAEFPQSKITDLLADLAEKVDKEPGKVLSDRNFTQALLTKLNGLANYVHPNTHPVSMIDGLQAIIDQQNATIQQLNDTIIATAATQFIKWNDYRLIKESGGSEIYPETGDEIQGRGDGTLENGDNVRLEAVNDMPDIAQVVKADYKFLTSYA